MTSNIGLESGVDGIMSWIYDLVKLFEWIYMLYYLTRLNDRIITIIKKDYLKSWKTSYLLIKLLTRSIIYEYNNE